MEQKALEELTYQIISLLKKWQLWESIEILWNGKCYASFPSDGWLSPRPCTRGFRDYKDVWVSLAECHWRDEYLSYYMYPPESDPVMFITCEGTALSDLLGSKRETMSIFALPYYDDETQIAEFKKQFYGLFAQYGIHCMPIGLYYSTICFEEKVSSSVCNWD